MLEKPCWIQHGQSHSSSTADVWWRWSSHTQHQGNFDFLGQVGPSSPWIHHSSAPRLRFWLHCVPAIPLKMVAVFPCYHNDAFWCTVENNSSFAKLSLETSVHFLYRTRKMGKLVFSPIFLSENKIPVKKQFKFSPSLNIISLTFASTFKEISFLKREWELFYQFFIYLTLHYCNVTFNLLSR